MTTPLPPDLTAAFPPFCGEEYGHSDRRDRQGLWVMVCTRPVHGKEFQHVNDETGFRWW